MSTQQHAASPPAPSTAPQSRRERPAKPALTRQGVIAAALTILRAEGLEKVTMRRIATALDTGPSSLYVYVRDTEDLHAQILDALLAEVSASPTTEGTWRDQLKRLLTRYMRVLFDYPEIARMTLTTHPSGPNYLALVERILSLLHTGGMPDRVAAWTVDLLLLYATADAAEHGARRSSTHAAVEDLALATVVASADAKTYPNIARLGSDLLSGGPSRFQWGLDVFITGALGAPHDSIETEQE